MSYRTPWGWLGVVVAVALVVGGCGGSEGSASKDGSGSTEPVKIGAFVYTQGALKAFGDETVGGVKLAVEQINENGGILGGRKIDLKIYEEGLNAGATTESIRRAKSDGVVAVVGFLDGTAATVAASLTDRLELPIVIAGAGTGSFVKNNTRPDLAHVLTYAEALYPTLDEWIKAQGAKKVTQLAYDSEYSRIAEKTHRENLKPPEIEFPETIYVPYGQTDVSEAAAKAVSSKPDTVLFDIWGDATVGAVKRMHELGFRGRSIQATVSMVDAHMKAAGEAVCDMDFMDTEYFYPSPEVPESQEFVESLKAKGRTLGGQTEPFYEGTRLLLEALDKAGTTDDREAIGKAMREVDFTTPRGAPMEVLENGQVYTPSWDLVQWDCESGSRKVIDKLELPKENFDPSRIIDSK